MLKQTDIFARRLKVANAYHSSHMDVIAESYKHSMDNLRVLPGKEVRTMHSSVTGESINWSEPGALLGSQSSIACLVLQRSARSTSPNRLGRGFVESRMLLTYFLKLVHMPRSKVL